MLSLRTGGLDTFNLLERSVAIKMLAVDTAKSGDLKERFEREARAVAAISHPNIVELFDVGVSDGLPYAVMEYLDGELLDARLKRGRMSVDELKHDKPRLYEQLVESGELENRLAAPAQPAFSRLVRVFGFSALFVGFTLVVLILYAMVLAYR